MLAAPTTNVPPPAMHAPVYRQAPGDVHDPLYVLAVQLFSYLWLVPAAAGEA